jgi:hypothetical protein
MSAQTRAVTAYANNPAIAPAALAEQTGLSVIDAVAWLRAKRGITA